MTVTTDAPTWAISLINIKSEMRMNISARPDGSLVMDHTIDLREFLSDPMPATWLFDGSDTVGNLRRRALHRYLDNWLDGTEPGL